MPYSQGFPVILNPLLTLPNPYSCFELFPDITLYHLAMMNIRIYFTDLGSHGRDSQSITKYIKR